MASVETMRLTVEPGENRENHSSKATDGGNRVPRPSSPASCSAKSCLNLNAA